MVQINRKIVLAVFTFKVNPYRQTNIGSVWFLGIAEFECHFSDYTNALQPVYLLIKHE